MEEMTRSMNNIKQLFEKYKSIILYIFFGGCTTLINIIVYAVCSKALLLETIPSTIIAWILSVVFAYVTNRRFVFDSKASQFLDIIKEMVSFLGCRILTGVLDIVLMYVFVDIIGVNDMLMKILSNIIVIVLNYVASKLFIFKQDN